MVNSIVMVVVYSGNINLLSEKYELAYQIKYAFVTLFRQRLLKLVTLLLQSRNTPLDNIPAQLP